MGLQVGLEDVQSEVAVAGQDVLLSVDLMDLNAPEVIAALVDEGQGYVKMTRCVGLSRLVAVWDGQR